MYIKIFFDDKPLFLCDEVDEIIQPVIHQDDAVYIDELNSHTIKTIIHEMGETNVQAGVFLHADLEALRNSFYKKFTVLIAAGGLVENEKKEILLIFRKGKWDLPKGKLDKGETLEACAIREVGEETGLQRIKLISPITITYHTYHEGTKFFLKESHWYHMKVSGKQITTPQTEEDIHEIKWVKKEDLKEYLENAFPSIKDVLKIHTGK